MTNSTSHNIVYENSGVIDFIMSEHTVVYKIFGATIKVKVSPEEFEQLVEYVKTELVNVVRKKEEENTGLGKVTFPSPKDNPHDDGRRHEGIGSQANSKDSNLDSDPDLSTMLGQADLVASFIDHIANGLDFDMTRLDHVSSWNAVLERLDPDRDMLKTILTKLEAGPIRQRIYSYLAMTSQHSKESPVMKGLAELGIEIQPFMPTRRNDEKMKAKYKAALNAAKNSPTRLLGG